MFGFLILQLSCAVCDGHRMSGVSCVQVCSELTAPERRVMWCVLGIVLLR